MTTKYIGSYSGKGGVGKTTVATLLVTNLLKHGKKVFALDMDLHTPSLHKMFEDFSHPNFEYASTGKLGSALLYLPDTLITQYVNDTLKAIKKQSPDFVIVDFGPSIMESHVKFVERIDLSGLILVTQPTDLAMEDVKRTISFFNTKGVPVLGMVYNDNTGFVKDGGTYTPMAGYPTLFEIPNDSVRFKDKNALKQEGFLDEFGIMEKLLDTKDSVVRTAKVKMLLGEDSTVTDAQVREMFMPSGIVRGFGGEGIKPYFINLKTWDTVKEIIEDYYEHVYPNGNLQYATTDSIGRTLEAFRENNKALFRVIRAPNVDRFYIPGEIIEVELDTETDFFYKIPMLKHGTYRFYIGELSPIGQGEYEEALNDGFTIHGDRLIPPKEVVEDIYNAFGSRTGLSSNWEEKYNRDFL